MPSRRSCTNRPSALLVASEPACAVVTAIDCSDGAYVGPGFDEMQDCASSVDVVAQHNSAASLLIEDKASSTQLIHELKYELHHTISACKPPPNTDKVVRLRNQTVAFESGKVYLPESAPWLDDYVDELTGFPCSTYDDQVDSKTQALPYVRDSSQPLVSFIRIGAQLQ